jgi:hypothetical protein
VVVLAGALLLMSLVWPRLDLDNPRRQVSGMATLVGSSGALLLAGGAHGLLMLTLAWSSSRPVAALAAEAGIFALTGLVSAAVVTVAPRRLKMLLLR